MLVKRMIAVAGCAALIVGAAWTATALASEMLVPPADDRPVASAMTTPTPAPGVEGTVTVPVGPGTHAPWYNTETTQSVPTTGAPFGWTIRMLAHMKQSGETSGTPFGWTVRMLAHMKKSGETTMPVIADGMSFGQWARSWAHPREGVESTGTLAPAFRPGARVGATRPRPHGPKTVTPGAVHRPTRGSATADTPSAAAAPGSMGGPAGMMGRRK